MLKAPWTEEQVRNLNKYQVIGLFHPYTCGGKKDGKDCRADLIATKDGWICPEGCGYTQDFAYEAMASDMSSDLETKEPGLFKKLLQINGMTEEILKKLEANDWKPLKEENGKAGDKTE